MEGVARESPRRDKRKLRSLLAGVKSDDRATRRPANSTGLFGTSLGLDAVPTPGPTLTVANQSSTIRGVLNYYHL